MSINGAARSYHKAFKFIVSVEGFSSARFQECSELSVEAADVDQWQGGAVIPDKSPGRLTFADITLSRGATQDKDMFNWFKKVADFASQAGEPDPAYKRQIDIVQLDRDDRTLRRWRVKNAYPKKFVAGAWNNDSDENVMESITLRYDTFDLIQ